MLPRLSQRRHRLGQGRMGKCSTKESSFSIPPGLPSIRSSTLHSPSAIISSPSLCLCPSDPPTLLSRADSSLRHCSPAKPDLPGQDRDRRASPLCPLPPTLHWAPPSWFQPSALPPDVTSIRAGTTSGRLLLSRRRDALSCCRHTGPERLPGLGCLRVRTGSAHRQCLYQFALTSPPASQCVDPEGLASEESQTTIINKVKAQKPE